MEKTLEELWSSEFEKFIVAQSAQGDEDPCGGSAGGMPPA